MEYSYDLRIPRDRIAVLIGTKGELKAKIEQEVGCKLHIDSKEGDIIISGEDALNLLTAREIVKAIGRGFNPEISFELLKSNYMLEILEIHDYVGKSKKDEMRVKGRIIGAEGKSRRIIEELTQTYISVYGKTIAIIGEVENIAIARKAIETLISGSPHSTVYGWLEKQRKNMNLKSML